MSSRASRRQSEMTYAKGLRSGIPSALLDARLPSSDLAVPHVDGPNLWRQSGSWHRPKPYSQTGHQVVGRRFAMDRNIATSFDYLDTPTVKRAGIPLQTGGTKAMNYTREQLDAILDKYAPLGWQMSFHVNGDIGLDIVLDAYEYALVKRQPHGNRSPLADRGTWVPDGGTVPTCRLAWRHRFHGAVPVLLLGRPARRADVRDADRRELGSLQGRLRRRRSSVIPQRWEA